MILWNVFVTRPGILLNIFTDATVDGIDITIIINTVIILVNTAFFLDITN